MTPQRWAQVSHIYHDALARDSRDRHAFLDEACRGDEALRREVESLLGQSGSAEDFLAEPALAVAARLVADAGAPSLAGQTVGAYQILDRLGVGGMGEVYRARDTKLGREVALKVLPRLFSADRERLARFQREARLLASLNHPHIAAIYGFEEAAGVQALVLELVDGPTLAERLERGPLPIAHALRIARQIAQALEAAHEKGIVHRDLKPQNIKVRADGTVKVLDFGLAKAVIAAATDADVSPPAVSTSLDRTQDGVILGTTRYMSPEQARGQPVDKRTDIWAFGCVLYEMLTGQAAFAGRTTSDTIAAILERELDLSKLPATIPPSVRRLLRRCVEKNRQRRLRDIGDAYAELEDDGWPDALERSVRAPRRSLEWILMLAIGAAVGGAGVWLASRSRSRDVQPSFSRVLRLTTTPAHEFGPAISPDGKWVAYLSDARGPTDVWVTFIAGGEPANLTASTNLEIQVRSAIGGLEISPDGTSIAVQAREKDSASQPFDTWLIPAPLGGTPRKFVETSGALRWSPDGTRIVYVRPGESRGDAIVVADGNGANARDLVAARGGWHTHWPAWSADGQFVYFSTTIATWNGEPSEIFRVAVTGGEPQTVVPTTRRALFPLPRARESLIYAANPNRVDLDLWWRSSTKSEPVRLTTGVGEYAEPRMSADGRKMVSTLIEYRRALVSIPVVFDDNPRPHQLTDGFGGDLEPSLLPSGGRMVFSSSRAGSRNLWSADADGSSTRPLTSDAAIEERPASSADGRHVAFVSDRGGEHAIWVVSSDGGTPQRIARTPCSRHADVVARWPSDRLRRSRRRSARTDDRWLQ